MNGVRPTARLGHSKRGCCGVCGEVGPLSWTHVPPHCAGNVQPFRALVWAPDPNGTGTVTALGHQKDGGAAGYFLCRKCNNDAGAWYDPAFGSFWHHLARALLVHDQMPPAGGPHLLIAEGVDPGAVVRSILSGMMAINPRLRTDFPSLSEAVHDEKQVAPPDGLYLLLAFTPDLQLRVSGGGSERQEVRGGRLVRSVFVHAEFAWAPLYLVLTDESGRQYWQSSHDILPWLVDQPGRRRPVNMLIPLLRTDSVHGSDIHLAARRAGFRGPNGEIAICPS